MRAFHIKDSSRGPLSIVRLQFHPSVPRLLAQIVDSSLALWDLDGKPAETKDRNAGPAVPGSKCCAHEPGWIRDFDVAPSGQWLATSGSDRHLKLWRWTEGKLKEKATAGVAAHDGWVEAVAFSPDGKHIATGGSDRTVKLWDALDLKPIRTMTGHTGFVRDLAWIRDGLLASGAEDGKVIIWDVAAGKLVRPPDAAEVSEQQGQTPEVGGVHRVAISRDGQWLAAAGRRRVSLFRVETGDLVATGAARLQAAFHPAADILAVGDETVKVYHYMPDKFVPVARDKTGKPTRAEAIPGKELGTIKLGGFSLGVAFTAAHPFYAHGKGWVPAALLEIGDLLRSHDGQWGTVDDLLETGERETVYN